MKLYAASCAHCLWQHRCFGEKCSELYRHHDFHPGKDAVRYSGGDITYRHETITMTGTLKVEGPPTSITKAHIPKTIDRSDHRQGGPPRNTERTGSSTTPRPARQPSASRRP